MTLANGLRVAAAMLLRYVTVVVRHRFIVVGGGLAGLSSGLLASSGYPDFMVACNSATGVGRGPSCLCIYRTSAASQSNWQH